ncbi:flavin reductase family protein [Acidothermaceae bacterium B102]|nr:flavin reductase family protein [Acidothermaceae bacterium B102]
MTATLLDPRRLRDVFGAFPTGVTTVAACVDGSPAGLVASSFTSVSLDPPLVSVCIRATSRTWPRLSTASRIGISVLGEHHGELSAAMSRSGADRFSGVGWQTRPGGAVLLTDAIAWLDCSIYAEHSAGDHRIVVLAVHDLDARDGSPLVFHGSRYRRLSEVS